MSLAALIDGNQKHYLDHLAPLASFLDIPLIINDLEIETLAKAYYPDLQLLYFHPIETAEKVTSEFDVILSNIPKDLFDSLFLISTSLHQKTLINIWCPHGNSDKGYASSFMEGLSKERWACVYGKKMIDFLKEKKVYDQLDSCFILGNYRYEYFKRHQSFYSKLMETTLPLNLGKKNLLYAPTWQDSERSSSFEMAHSSLINSVPKDWNLIIKPHPELPCNIHSSKDNILILNDFPPIYPLLSITDVYLGDMSSIGYDFLTFKRPLFFYNPNERDPKTDKGLYLTQCGIIVNPKDNLFETIEKKSSTSFLKIQEAVYDEVFEKRPDNLWHHLKIQLKGVVSASLPEIPSTTSIT